MVPFFPCSIAPLVQPSGGTPKGPTSAQVNVAGHVTVTASQLAPCTTMCEHYTVVLFFQNCEEPKNMFSYISKLLQSCCVKFSLYCLQ